MSTGPDPEPRQPTPPVTGAAELAEWFGRWPSFHDAEIISLHLNRRGSSFLDLHSWRLGPADPANGTLGRERECVVRFTLIDIEDLELADFSRQNVIFGLSLETEGSKCRIELAPCYGLAGYIECGGVAVTFTKGGPAQD